MAKAAGWGHRGAGWTILGQILSFVCSSSWKKGHSAHLHRLHLPWTSSASLMVHVTCQHRFESGLYLLIGSVGSHPLWDLMLEYPLEKNNINRFNSRQRCIQATKGILTAKKEITARGFLCHIMSAAQRFLIVCDS